MRIFKFQNQETHRYCVLEFEGLNVYAFMETLTGS
jgi:hypothetical protein